MLVIVLLMMVGAATGAVADTALLGGVGGSAYLVGSSSIALESEAVDIAVSGHSMMDYGPATSAVKVNAQFVLHNLTSKKQTFKIGFPEAKGERGHPIDLRDFKATVEGKAVAVKAETAVLKPSGKAGARETDPEYRRWFTWTMSIAPNARAKVTTSYSSALTIGMYLDHPERPFDFSSSGSFWRVNYILKPAPVGPETLVRPQSPFGETRFLWSPICSSRRWRRN